MKQIYLLECTLRDGGYITDWKFSDKCIKDIIASLIEANLDLIEVGYLNRNAKEKNTTLFSSVEKISEFLPTDRKGKTILAMADVTQFYPEDLTPYDGSSIDGIRVVFYKHQANQAIKLCRKINEMDYKLFVQPMVTIDYTVEEYTQLISSLCSLNPCAVSIVDSFGYMNKEDFRTYFEILNDQLSHKAMVGFHSHNNMNLAFITAQDVMEYETERKLVIDCSLYGMGRGAGNLQTELITNYYNMCFQKRYNISEILRLISEYIMPVYTNKRWGYSPYFLLTGLCHCHPNFASYLLQEYDVSVSEFEKYVQLIPDDMKTKCRKPYVIDLFRQSFYNN
ncbi:4-hydroxy-2-oxovalerate aldolase [Lachnospiraceae bacterium]|nr:4-hydroxy-2-oxovalerate aldolase [Lachnospiraceae bacterium]